MPGKHGAVRIVSHSLGECGHPHEINCSWQTLIRILVRKLNKWRRSGAMIKEVYLEYMGSKTKQKIETTYQLHLFKFTICMMTMEGHVSQANKLNSYFLVICCAHHRYISPDKPPRLLSISVSLLCFYT